ncbi:hypothetical protein MKX03_001128 [Papaver bracteatum]|nr:hypothetical protein MKX03_001128 [Papaver bracteatum]
MNNLPPDEKDCFCLCYDPLIEKHKVVFCGPNGILRSNRHESSPFLQQKIKIITVGDGLGEDPDPWRYIVLPDAFHLSGSDVDSFYLFGPRFFTSRNCKPCDYLHSMVKPHGTDEYYILRLDATREAYVKIKLPDEVSTLKLQCVLNETEGLLCLSHYTTMTHELRVWTLKEYHCDEWGEIRFSFSTEDTIRKSNVSSIRPLTILTVPKMKLIFAADYYDEREIFYVPMCSYYSYDIELKQLELIHGPSYFPLHWHANTFANC